MKAYGLIKGLWDWSTTVPTVAGAVTLLFTYLMGRVFLRQCRRSQVFVFVDPDAVFVRDPEAGNTIRFPLIEIRRAEKDRLGRLVLHLSDRVVTTEMMGGMLSQIEPCTAYVNWQAHVANVNRSKIYSSI